MGCTGTWLLSPRLLLLGVLKGATSLLCRGRKPAAASPYWVSRLLLTAIAARKTPQAQRQARKVFCRWCWELEAETRGPHTLSKLSLTPFPLPMKYRDLSLDTCCTPAPCNASVLSFHAHRSPGRPPRPSSQTRRLRLPRRSDSGKVTTPSPPLPAAGRARCLPPGLLGARSGNQCWRRPQIAAAAAGPEPRAWPATTPTGTCPPACQALTRQGSERRRSTAPVRPRRSRRLRGPRPGPEPAAARKHSARK